MIRKERSNDKDPPVVEDSCKDSNYEIGTMKVNKLEDEGVGD